MTNQIYLITVLVTNWAFTGDTKFEKGTNYIQLREVVTKQTMVEEVTLCTNRTIYKVGPMMTNGVKWHPGPAVPLPPALPTVSLGQH